MFSRFNSQDVLLCEEHFLKQCELYCEDCDVPICIFCVSSQRHKTHDINNIRGIFEVQKEILQRDLQKLRCSIYPKYQEYALEIRRQKANVDNNSKKLNVLLTEQGKVWHKEIDKIINKMKSEIGEINVKSLNALKEQEGIIQTCFSEITRKITNLQKLLDSNDVNLISSYKSRVRKYRKFPSKVIISLPIFTPQKINRKQMYDQFGFLSSSLNKTEEHNDVMYHSDTDISSKKKLLADKPRVIQFIQTEYKNPKRLLNVSCSRDDEIWACARDNVIHFFCFHVDMVKSIKTRNLPFDITVTRKGDLVYTDVINKTVNIVKNTQINTLIKLRDWRPLNICSTSTDDLLVFINSDDDEKTKIVRYCGSIEKQTIQFDKNGKPLFSTNFLMMNNSRYLCENRNRDICVSNTSPGNVLVVNHAGDIRFIYNGFPSSKKKPFNPRGIATDSQSRILIVDIHNKCIHIVDQDGQFLRYIENCGLRGSFTGVCVDTKDNLFVTEDNTGRIQKVQYYV